MSRVHVGARHARQREPPHARERIRVGHRGIGSTSARVQWPASPLRFGVCLGGFANRTGFAGIVPSRTASSNACPTATSAYRTDRGDSGPPLIPPSATAHATNACTLLGRAHVGHATLPSWATNGLKCGSVSLHGDGPNIGS